MNELQMNLDEDQDYPRGDEPGIYQPYENDSLTVDIKPKSMISEDLIDEMILDSVINDNKQALFDILDGVKKLFMFKYKEKLELILWSCSYFNKTELKTMINDRENI